MACFPGRLPACAVLLYLAPILGASSGNSPTDPGWPREYSDGTATLVLHQPEVDSWTDFRRLKGRFAIVLTPTKGAPAIYGVLSVEAETRINTETRTVEFENFRVTDVRYPAAKTDAERQDFASRTTKLMPSLPATIALDRLLAYEANDRVIVRQSAVTMDPPPILVATQPAVLVSIDGDPITVPFEGTSLRKVVNTNWDLLADDKTGTYYLRLDKTWLSAKGLSASWSAATKLPKELAKLSDKETPRTASKKPRGVTLVLIVRKPSELIVVDGNPRFQEVPGTNLQWVANSECDLFQDTTDGTFYFLTSGRWFRSAMLKSNSWQPATAALPEDFKRIPPNHPASHVLASVPGTREAQEAALMASIPRLTRIERRSITTLVPYDGTPRFAPIGGTGIEYAVNTPSDVVKAGNLYYLCLEGVWLVANMPEGPWETTDKIPDDIRSIPSDSPKYHLSYVTVDESTPAAITYSYTTGYLGMYVGSGVAVWGTGFASP